MKPIIIKSLLLFLDAEIAFRFFFHSCLVVMAGLSQPGEKVAIPVGVV